MGYLQSISQLLAVHDTSELGTVIEKITESMFHNMGGNVILLVRTDCIRSPYMMVIVS